MDAQAIAASREYHAKREARRLAAREQLRLERLAAVRAAILQLAPDEPRIEAASLYGSILRPGGFRSDSDIDIALDCDDVRAESRFWRALEQTLDHDCDVRPRRDAIARAVATSGERVYARESPRS